MQESMRDHIKYFDGIIANMMLEKDKFTNEIYKQLKNDTINFINKKNKKIYSPKDWYKEFINVRKEEVRIGYEL